jgi:hypothetical protein
MRNYDMSDRGIISTTNTGARRRLFVIIRFEIPYPRRTPEKYPPPMPAPDDRLTLRTRLCVVVSVSIAGTAVESARLVPMPAPFELDA